MIAPPSCTSSLDTVLNLVRIQCTEGSVVIGTYRIEINGEFFDSGSVPSDLQFNLNTRTRELINGSNSVILTLYSDEQMILLQQTITVTITRREYN